MQSSYENLTKISKLKTKLEITEEKISGLKTDKKEVRKEMNIIKKGHL